MTLLAVLRDYDKTAEIKKEIREAKEEVRRNYVILILSFLFHAAEISYKMSQEICSVFRFLPLFNMLTAT